MLFVLIVILKEEDKILDPTAGSFNSGHSALGLNRNYIGMEMNDEFYDKNKILEFCSLNKPKN
tara:strand:+ start:511 stop:699 length:189 start_codon:yes stop_codon:yes gene_type:complete